MNRKRIVIANWKMNEDVESALALGKKIKSALSSELEPEVVICPDFVSLVSLSQLFQNSKIVLGAQNVAEEEKGAYTGEVSVLSLRPFVKYIIVGHSERRNLIGEGDREIAKKAELVIRHKITPVICVGETLHEREDGLSKVVVLSQLEADCKHLTANEIARSVISYEPVWAIGSGKNCEPEDVVKIIENIRGLIKTLYGEKAAAAVRIVYGGSVQPNNAKVFAGIEDLDGILVGGASLHSSEFVAIINNFKEAR